MKSGGPGLSGTVLHRRWSSFVFVRRGGTPLNFKAFKRVNSAVSVQQMRELLRSGLNQSKGSDTG